MAEASGQAKPRLLVAAALLEREGRVLMARRGPEGPCAGLWEFPGGKCREGEGLGGCVVREIAEELGLRIEAGEELGAVEHDYGRYSVSLHLLRVRGEGDPQALGCAEFSWVRPEEIEGLNLAPADRRLLEAVPGARVQLPQ